MREKLQRASVAPAMRVLSLPFYMTGVKRNYPHPIPRDSVRANGAESAPTVNPTATVKGRRRVLNRKLAPIRAN